MIREEEDNEKEVDEKEGVGEGDDNRIEKIPIKLTRELLAEQHKILNSIVKKKAKTEPAVVEIIEESDLIFDESEMLEQSQILASIQQERRNLNQTKSTESKAPGKSIEITIDPNKDRRNNKEDIFSDVFSTKTSKTSKTESGTETIASVAKETLVKTLENLPQTNKVIEITLDPNKIKEGIGNDEDIFSDVFRTIGSSKESDAEVIEAIEGEEDIIMSDTSSESSDDVAISDNVPANIIERVDHKEVIKDFKKMIENAKEDKDKAISKGKDNSTSLEKEIFDDIDEANSEEDEIMSDNSDSSVEDLSKVCEFISETTSKPVDKTGQANQSDTISSNKSNIRDKIDEIANATKVKANMDENVKHGSIENKKAKDSINEIVKHVDINHVPNEQAQSNYSQISQTCSSNIETNVSNTPNIEETNSVSPKISKSFLSRTIDPAEPSCSTSISIEKTSNVSFSLPCTSSNDSLDASPSTSGSTPSSLLDPNPSTSSTSTVFLDPTNSVAVSTIKHILNSNDSSENQSSSMSETLQASTSKETYGSRTKQAFSNKKESYFKTNLNETQTKKLLEYQ
ncbi:hypothetical protein WDU94_008827, partial [Cyamophila willieti]